MFDIRYEGDRAFFNVHTQYATLCFELSLQPSGAVLVDLRRFGSSGTRSFYSKYASRILRDLYIDDAMYGKGNKFALTENELHTIDQACRGLRDRNSFDPSLAAGETIQEMYH